MAATLNELIVWQLADELRRAVHALAALERVRADLRFAYQMQDSASGVCRNIAEGFGRVRPTEFAQFLLIARGSLLELEAHLSDGAARGHWRECDVAEIVRTCRRTRAAITGLVRYLRTPEAARNAARWEDATHRGKHSAE
ncbi:MAG: four helix bundle protein [Vicinamibacterales bacterium]